MNLFNSVMFYFGFCLAFTHLNGEPIIRAAFDQGSGRTKVSVAKIENSKITILYSDKEAVFLGDAFKRRKDGTIGKEALTQAEKAIEKFVAKAKELGATELAGVGTAIFREAKDGPDFIEKIRNKFGIDLSLVTQEEEGRLGFLTAIAASGLSPEEVTAWDSGNSSFQLTTQDGETLTVYEGPWGSAKVMAAMIEEVQGKDYAHVYSPNPVSQKDIEQLKELILTTLPPPPKTLKQVIGIGGDASIFAVMKDVSGKIEWNRNDVELSLQKLANLPTHEIGKIVHIETDYAVPKLTLLLAVMEKLNIQKVTYTPTMGSTPGILLAKEFWEAPADR